MTYINLDFCGRKDRSDKEKKIFKLVQVALNGNNHSTPAEKKEARRKLRRFKTKVFSQREIKRYEQRKRNSLP